MIEDSQDTIIKEDQGIKIICNKIIKHIKKETVENKESIYLNREAKEIQNKILYMSITGEKKLFIQMANSRSLFSHEI
jgi:hypothetical protein